MSLKFMFANKLLSTKVGAKLMFDLVIFLISSISSSDIPLNFRESIQVVQLKYLMY